LLSSIVSFPTSFPSQDHIHSEVTWPIQMNLVLSCHYVLTTRCVLLNIFDSESSDFLGWIWMTSLMSHWKFFSKSHPYHRRMSSFHIV
jgi:hypothetical protein